MGDISTWNPVDNSNTMAPPDGWPENQSPSSVNNCARAMMGAVRRWYDTVTAQIAGMLPQTGGTITGALTVNGALTGGSITATGSSATAIYAPNGGLSVLGDVHSGASVTCDTSFYTAGSSPTGAIYAPNGGMTIGGTIHSGASITCDTSFYTTGSGVTALYAPNGGMTVGTVVHAGGQIISDASFYTTGTGVTAIYAPNGGITVGGGMTAYGTGTAAIYAPNGGITAGGEIHSGASITCDTSFYTIGSSPALAFYAPNGGMTVGGIVNSTSSDAAAIYAPNGGLQVGHNVVCAQGWKPGGGLWADSSDIRTKREIEVYPAGLTEVMALRPVKYFKNGRGESVDDGRQFVGLVADEVRPVMPEMVGTVQRLLDPGDQQASELLTLDATPLIYALVNSCQELAAQNAALATRITVLEGNHV